MRIAFLVVLTACTPIGDGIVDASSDVSNDTGDASSDAQAEAVAPCKNGLPDAGTLGVVCGALSCGSPDICCVGATDDCVPASSCGNVDFVWACDRSAHCGAGKTCCYSLLASNLSVCPGASASTSPTCETAPSSTCSVVCQTDADCNAGQTCYAVFLSAAKRTIGICR